MSSTDRLADRPARRALLVAEPDDPTVRALLGMLGPDARAVSPARLATACWSHTVDRDGRSATTVSTLRGERLGEDSVGRVWCRTDGLRAPQFARAGPRDRAYADAELNALLVSWLFSLGDRVVNRVVGTTASGPGFSPARWRHEARAAGLPVAVAPPDVALAVGHGEPTVLVAGTTVLDAPEGWRDACRVMARGAGCRLLGVQVERGRDGPVVGAITTTPTVRSVHRLAAVGALLTAPR